MRLLYCMACLTMVRPHGSGNYMVLIVDNFELKLSLGGTRTVVDQCRC